MALILLNHRDVDILSESGDKAPNLLLPSIVLNAY